MAKLSIKSLSRFEKKKLFFHPEIEILLYFIIILHPRKIYIYIYNHNQSVLIGIFESRVDVTVRVAAKKRQTCSNRVGQGAVVSHFEIIGR